MTGAELQTWLRIGASAARRALVMGILNVTPDSFSDGGAFIDVSKAAEQADAMIAGGADLIDVGGESTRPGSGGVDEAEQLRRVVPVIAAIRKRSNIGLSVDTTRSAVARAALDAGADWINDISAGRDDARMLPLAAEHRAPIILMHMQGTPATMQANPTYRNVTGEVADFLRERLDSARTAGADPADVLLDPGIGFGKSVEHNLQLLRHIDELASIGRPLVIGTSRKGFIAAITGESEAKNRLMGTAATIAWAVANGAAVVRVHDVEAMAKAVRMTEAIREAGRTMNDELRTQNEGTRP